jgi:hypothetical protein
MHTYIHTCMHAYMHTCMRTHTYIYIYIYIYIHTHARTNIVCMEQGASQVSPQAWYGESCCHTTHIHNVTCGFRTRRSHPCPSARQRCDKLLTLHKNHARLELTVYHSKLAWYRLQPISPQRGCMMAAPTIPSPYTCPTLLHTHPMSRTQCEHPSTQQP